MTNRSAAAPAAPRGADTYARLRIQIVRGDLAPGTRVGEAELAQQLGVSRTPAREAVRRLLAEGLVVRDGGGGARPRVAVAPVAAADVLELYHAAGALEGVAAREVVHLSSAERRSLAAELEAREARFQRASTARRLDYDVLFERHNAVHDALRDACAGSAIRALLAALQPRLDRYEWLYAPIVGPDFSATYREHAAIVRAVRSGPAAVAEHAVRANWFNGGQRLARALGDAENARRPDRARRAQVRRG
jgi:DNA-binding GntR family transcriptional regulator